MRWKEIYIETERSLIWMLNNLLTIRCNANKYLVEVRGLSGKEMVMDRVTDKLQEICED